MTNYQRHKDNIRNLINDFDLFDDMSKLAEALEQSKDIMKLEGIPLEEFKQWLKKKK